jgi:uncharacterized protein (TIGR03118 family)
MLSRTCEAGQEVFVHMNIRHTKLNLPWMRWWRLGIGIVTTASLIAIISCGSGNSGNAVVSTYYQRTDLVSDQAGATHLDTNLVNPWGIAYGPSTPFMIANNHSGTSTEYDGSGTPMPATPLVVTVPSPTAGSVSAPAGEVFNATTGFSGDTFIFSTEDGTIAGWSSGTDATIRRDNSASGAVYKGLAIGVSGTTNYIYATNFSGGTVDVFDTDYAPVQLGTGAFTDPTLPTGFNPFGILGIGNKLYVTFAQRVPPDNDETHGPGLGYVSVFNMDGTFVKRLVSAGPLNAPWGIAMAPSGFGTFGGALLIGNFGDGYINAFDATTGTQLGHLSDAGGHPIAIQGLWGLIFGNGTSAGKSSQLYFTAGVQDEDHGLFGAIAAIQSVSNTGGGGGGGGY